MPLPGQLSSLDRTRKIVGDTSGWTFTEAIATVTIADPKAQKPAYRRTYVPQVTVPAIVVNIEGGARRPDGTPERASLCFVAETGKYVADRSSQNLTGSVGWPISINRVLAYIEKRDADGIAAIEATRQAYEDERQAKRDAEVAEAYAAATQALTEAQHAAYVALLAEGLTEVQATAVVILTQQKDNVLAVLSGAAYNAQRCSIGRIPGRISWNSDEVYENGKRVSA